MIWRGAKGSIALVAALLLIGCEAPSPTAPPPATALPSDAEAARPTFKVGDEFWFSDRRSIFVEAYVGEQDGLLVFDLGTRRETRHYTPDLALVDVHRPFGTDRIYEPDDGLLSFPLRVGKTWNRSYRVISFDGSRSQQRTRHCEVVRTAPVSVPAGAFAAFHIDCTVRELGAPNVVHEEIAYAPAVGRVILHRTRGQGFDIRLTEFKRAQQ